MLLVYSFPRGVSSFAEPLGGAFQQGTPVFSKWAYARNGCSSVAFPIPSEAQGYLYPFQRQGVSSPDPHLLW